MQTGCDLHLGTEKATSSSGQKMMIIVFSLSLPHFLFVILASLQKWL